jgi:oligoendopeptidase F
MTKERSEISTKDKWNVEKLYPSLTEWESDFKHWSGASNPLRFPQINAYRGQLGSSAKKLKDFLDIYLDIDRHLSKLYTYAHLRHDEDVANDAHKQAYARVTSLLHDFRQEVAWIEPEILQLPEKQLTEYLKADELKGYHILLEKIIRMKPHTLSAEKEELIALAGMALDSSQRAFSAFNNADLKFPSVLDEKGNMCDLTHGKYLAYLRGRDRALRKNAFEAVHSTYAKFENTICELLNGEMQQHLFNSRSRGYASCLQAALFPHQIEPVVYTALIEKVHEHLPSLHRYMALRKKLLGYEELHTYDLHVPLVEGVDLSMPYQEGESLVVDSVSALGTEYQDILRQGMLKDRWVDVYETPRKRSGAYSSGCYDSMPYILMNYQGTFSDVMTLAHEAGHSMHSYLSHKHQPYCYSQYPIFVAEVASTFNEELLSKKLLSKVKNKKERAYLINQKIDDIRGTFFRQTLFAEFELKLHTWVEQGVPLTPTLLRTEYRKLNLAYFGPDVTLDDAIDIEWARIPHFYYNFYVYQYATGISAAFALYDRVEKEGEKARLDYLTFLSSGCSHYPLDLLKMAGVDMRKGTAVSSLITHFDALTNELEKVLMD